MRIKLTNNLTKTEYVFDDLEDKMVSEMFYAFDITVPRTAEIGEYQYTLFEGDMVLATGLLQIGEYHADVKSYKHDTIKESNGFISYNG